MDPYKEKIETVTNEYDANLENGLSSSEVEEKLKNNGKNKFEEAPKESLAKKFFLSLTDFTTIILLVAAVISLYTAIATDHGDYFESFLIIAIVVINSVLAIVQEGNAEKALSALQDMNKQTASVMRDGKQEQVDAEELVPGDTLLL
ncbi:cation-transporting P-type ATPase, partial [Enterococcus sp. 12E11_DIV0728]